MQFFFSIKIIVDKNIEQKLVCNKNKNEIMKINF